MGTREKKFRYLDLADQIQARIESGAIRLSERLPSLRELCQQTGFSMTTVFQAYVELEKRGAIISRQRSGYFVRPRAEKLSSTPKMGRSALEPRKIDMDDIIHQLTQDMGNPELLRLGSVAVAPEHLPWARLHKHLKSIPKPLVPNLVAGYVHPQGAEDLRQQIANLLFPLIPGIGMEEIIVTAGCTEALGLSLKAVARAGQTVMVESPTDPWLRQAIKDFGLLTLEIPVHPETGIDILAVEKGLDKSQVAALLVNPNCQNPMGTIMPDDHKKALVDLLLSRNIPIIENDVSGEIHFQENRPRPLKRWDSTGAVLYCSSFSKVLAPGLRVGWVVPGRYKEAIQRIKLNQSLSSPALNQAVISAYLKEGAFARHLRRLRQTISLQHQYCAAAVAKHFPWGTRMTAPKGGQSLWIEMPKGISGRRVYQQARLMGISVLPGFLCTNFPAFDHCIRMGYGGFWDPSMEAAVAKVGSIVGQLAP